MPNWIECKLIINSKDKIALEDFIKKCETELKLKDHNDKIHKTKTVLSLNCLVPIPKRQEKNWYEWNIKNWGTKWEIDPDGLQRHKINGRTYKYYFDTAWSPPDEWLKKVGELYPTIKFKLKYKEPGMRFKGISTSINGIFENTYKDY
jgi:hypothetical protein